MKRNLFVENIINGNGDAIKQFVLMHRDQVYRTSLGYLQNVSDAEDLTQEVFIRALEKIHQFKGQSQLSSWLIRITINLAKNYLRDNKKRLNQLELSEVQIIEKGSSLEEHKEIKRMVRKAIQKLPEKQRSVFILSNYLDLSYSQISEVTGFTTSSVESLLFRARRKLREFLQVFYEEIKS